MVLHSMIARLSQPGFAGCEAYAEVAELVDALASGASVFTDVLVRLQSSVPEEGFKKVHNSP